MARAWLASALFIALLLGAVAPGFAAAQTRQPLHADRGRGATALADPRGAPPAEVDLTPTSSPPPADPWALDISVVTAIPTAVGADVRVETPGRFLLHAFIGANPYGSVLGDLVHDYGGGDTGRALVTAITSGATVFRLGAGIRPHPDAGLELLTGYTLMYSADGIDVAALEAATGQSLAGSGLTAVRLETIIHAVEVELGWRFVIIDHLVLRIGVGGTFAVGASSRLGVPDAMRTPGGPVMTAESDIANAITSYGFIPEARIGLGYRF